MPDATELPDLDTLTDAELDALPQAVVAAAMDRRLNTLVERVERLEDAQGQPCVECGRVWNDSSERWRTFLTIDDEPALYCSECADREFGGADA